MYHLYENRAEKNITQRIIASGTYTMTSEISDVMARVFSHPVSFFGMFVASFGFHSCRHALIPGFTGSLSCPYICLCFCLFFGDCEAYLWILYFDCLSSGSLSLFLFFAFCSISLFFRLVVRLFFFSSSYPF